MTDFSKGGAAGLDANSTDNIGVITNRIDFSKVNAAATVSHKALNTPAKSRVRNVVAEVIAAQGAAVTLTIGTASNGDGYIVTANGNVVGLTSDTGNAAETEVGVLRPTADGVYFTPSILLDTAIIRFSAEVVNYSFSETLI